MINNKNFCIQPWIHLASWNDGSVPLCCVAAPERGLNLNRQKISDIWNSDQFKSARLKFMAGEKIPQCSSCWKEESSGIKSHRMVENEMWSRKLGQDYIEKLINSTKQDGTVEHKPITLDLRLGNTCNLQCVMCRPRDSSKWLNDSKKLSEILTSPEVKADWQYKSTSITNTDMFDWFEQLETQEALQEFMSDIRHIIFGGGEPLLLKEHEQFIKKLVESGNSKHIELRYHTNGTILNEKFIDLWKNFKEVELMVSIDDWGQRNDYVRYPANWTTIESNLDRLDNTPDNIVVSILTTIHAMNVYNLPDFATNIINKKWKKVGERANGMFYTGTVHWPRYLALNILPQTLKQQIQTYWSGFELLNNNPRWQTRIKSQLEFMKSSDDSRFYGDFVDYIDKLDSIRPVKFCDLYPEYYSLIQKIN